MINQQDMFVAGTDTTASALEFAMSELARHPSIMKKAQDEVHGLKPKEGRVTQSHIKSLGFLKAIIKETLRLHPPVPLLVPRESMAPCTINGYHIPTKTRVLVNVFAIGRDPESWEDPLQFRPERFLEEGGALDPGKDPDFKLLPFGGGRRGWPRFSFGLATVQIAMARLLYHFDWALPQGIEADQLDLTEIFGLDVRKKFPLVLVPTVNEASPFVGK